MKKRLTPTGFFWLVIALALLLHFALRPLNLQLIVFPYTLLGLPVFALGMALNLRANNVMLSRGTSIEPFDNPSALVQEGPFRFSRNPVYLSGVVQLAGLATLLGSLSGWLLLLIWWGAMDRCFVRPEERVLAARFGAAYQDYRRRVRRWF